MQREIIEDVIVQYWTIDYAKEMKDFVEKGGNIFPRVYALAERALGVEQTDYEAFKERVRRMRFNFIETWVQA